MALQNVELSAAEIGGFRLIHLNGHHLKVPQAEIDSKGSLEFLRPDTSIVEICTGGRLPLWSFADAPSEFIERAERAIRKFRRDEATLSDLD